MLISATRSCIARSMTLLTPVTLDGVRRAASDLTQVPRAAGKSSSHPPSSRPL